MYRLVVQRCNSGARVADVTADGEPFGKAGRVGVEVWKLPTNIVSWTRPANAREWHWHLYSLIHPATMHRILEEPMPSEGGLRLTRLS
jgi:hypothetical protein